MKTFVRYDAIVLKQHFERKLVELEEEKEMLQVCLSWPACRSDCLF